MILSPATVTGNPWLLVLGYLGRHPSEETQNPRLLTRVFVSLR